MFRKPIRWLRIGVFLLAGLFLAGGVQASPKSKLIIFHAGSLTVPFAAMEKEFEARYPDIEVQREAGGSTRMARLITEIGKPADLMASADFQVIDQGMMPEHADFNIRFATNELVLIYSKHSQFSDEINQNNWFEILGRPGVEWGHADPNVDPGGYRSLMVIQLAEKYYQIPGLYSKLLDHRPKENLRDKSASLTFMVQNGDLDYAWTYRSLAIQHNLSYVSLDDHINLANVAHDAFYQQARVRVSGEKPGAFIDRIGRFVAYGITMTKNAPNPEAAETFLAYLLAPAGGQKILRQHGQPPFDHPFVPTRAMHGKLPEKIVDLVTVAN